MPLESTDRPIACDLEQIPAELRARLSRDFARVFGRAQALHALSDGFALEFSNEHGIVATLGELVEYDRRCCPFIRHTLVHEPWDGPIRLELTGTPEVREFIAVELLPFLAPELVRAAGMPQVTRAPTRETLP
jgi:hypothetical protein